MIIVALLLLGSVPEFYSGRRTYDEIVSYMDTITATPPASDVLVERDVVGQSHEGRDLVYWVFSSKRARSDRIFVSECSIHGDEDTSSQICTYFAEYLLTHPNLLGRYTVYIMPITNPDGYARNRRTNARPGCPVDLNRNWPPTVADGGDWGYVPPRDHQSKFNVNQYCESEVNAGPSAGSEPEVQSIVAYWNGKPDVYAALTHHCCGSDFIDWSYSDMEVVQSLKGGRTLDPNRLATFQEAGTIYVNAVNTAVPNFPPADKWYDFRGVRTNPFEYRLWGSSANFWTKMKGCKYGGTTENVDDTPEHIWPEVRANLNGTLAWLDYIEDDPYDSCDSIRNTATLVDVVRVYRTYVNQNPIEARDACYDGDMDNWFSLLEVVAIFRAYLAR